MREFVYFLGLEDEKPLRCCFCTRYTIRKIRTAMLLVAIVVLVVVVVVVVAVAVVVRASLLFDARFSEYATIENTGLRSEREDHGGLELGAANPCFQGFD